MKINTLILLVLASLLVTCDGPREDISRDVVFYVEFDDNHFSAGNSCEFFFNHPNGGLDSVFLADTSYTSPILLFNKGDTINCSLRYCNEDVQAMIFVDDSLWQSFYAYRLTDEYFQDILP